MAELGKIMKNKNKPKQKENESINASFYYIGFNQFRYLDT